MTILTISEDEPKRILIAGLPNSGVKTIKSVVVDNNPPHEIKAMIEKIEVGNQLREILQKRVLILDCGGEKSIQDIISEDRDPIYKHTQALVFILDITEQSYFSIAKYWFDALVKHLHKFSPEARIFLFLHKIDLIADNTNYADYIRATRGLFDTPGLDIFVHETSIFDASIYMAIRDILMKEADDQVSVNQYFTRILEGSSFVGMAVYSQDGLPIYEAGELPSVVEITANVMLSSLSRIKQELEPDDDVITTILEMKKTTFMVFRTVNKNAVFVALSKIRPKLGQMLIEAEQIVQVLQKAMN